MIEKIKNNKKAILILIGIIFLSSFWLLTSGMPYAHDIYFHYGRMIRLTDTIKSGDILALIHNGYFGYGYAEGIFYSNFFFYIPAIFNLIGFSYMVSFKLFYLFINTLTVIITYRCIKSISKDNKISILGTILYMFSNYRLVDIYPRGALGEVLAFMIIPIVILGIYEILYRDYKKWYLFTIGFVLLLLCHLITTFLLACFIFVFVLCSYKKLFEDKKRIKYLFISAGVGLLLGLFFLLPIIEQKLSGNINIFEGQSFFLPQDQIVGIKNFLLPTDFFNQYLGFSLVLLLPIRYFIKKKDINDSDKNILKFADILFALGIVAWLFTTYLFPWKILGNSLDFIQFPWRLLMIATVFLVFSYIVYIKLIKNIKVKKYIYVVIILFSILEILLYSVQYSVRKIQYNSFGKNEIGTGEYLPYNTDREKIEEKKAKVITNNNDLKYDYTKDGTTIKINYENNLEKDTYIEVPLFNYLGYSSKGAKIVNGDNNKIRLLLSKENGSIEVKYTGTNIQKVSYIVSGITFIGLVVYIIIEKRKENGIS